jgi:hypothetical protein
MDRGADEALCIGTGRAAGLGARPRAADKTGRVHRSVEFDPLYAECDRAAL